MGYQFTAQGANAFFKHLSPNYVIYAPKRFIENGAPADNYCARYGTVNVVEEIVAVKKAAFSFSDLLASIEQSLFSFIDDAEPMETGKEAIVFLRSCDLHAVKQLDAIYLNSRNPDYFYKKIRDKIHFVLMGCSEPFDDCFCVEQGTNISTDYSGAVNITKRGYTVDCKAPQFDAVLTKFCYAIQDVTPHFVSKAKEKPHTADLNCWHT